MACMLRGGCTLSAVVHVTRLPSPLVTRQCSRPTCSEAAEATLSYSHSGRTAWLAPLAGERDPHAYDLCDRHAGRVGVPTGWRLVDQRLVHRDRTDGERLLVAG